LVAFAALLRHSLLPEEWFRWVVQAGAVAAFVHWRLWRHLSRNARAGSDLPSPVLGIANRITLARGLLLCGIFGFLFCSPLRTAAAGDPLSWVPGLVYLVAVCLDGVDGALARRLGERTELGRILDVEMDALGILAASALGIWLGRLPAAYGVVAAAYYLFQFAIQVRHRLSLPVSEPPPRAFARTVAGFQMGFLVAALLPLFEPAVLHLASLWFAAPLLGGFLWDWLVVTGRTGRVAAAPWEGRVRGAARRLPVLFRLGLLVCAFPVAAELSRYPSPWPYVLWWGFAGMAAVGFLGRTAGVAAAVLLGASPAGADPSLAVRAALSASLLVALFGTGPGSFWRPEDPFLGGKAQTPLH
jgi:CDP-diacylglycerol--glycerol-3-phosphate 3-phosphatidyltransferase